MPGRPTHPSVEEWTIKKIHPLFAIAAAPLSGAAHVQSAGATDGGWCGRAQLGSAKVNQTNLGLDDSAGSGSVAIDFRFNPYWSAEADLVKLGELGPRATVGGSPANSCGDSSTTAASSGWPLPTPRFAASCVVCHQRSAATGRCRPPVARRCSRAAWPRARAARSGARSSTRPPAAATPALCAASGRIGWNRTSAAGCFCRASPGRGTQARPKAAPH
jgi:hypothetical protein